MQALTWVLIIGGVLWFVIGAVLIFIFVVMKRRFNKIVEIREILAAGDIKIIMDKARDYYPSDTRVKLWKLQREKDKLKKFMPIPPNEYIQRDEKGRLFIVVYRTETGEYIFRRDNVKIGEIPKDLYAEIPEALLKIENVERRALLINKWKKLKYTEWLKEGGLSVGFEPFTSNQRVLVTTNIRNAEEKRKKSFWDNISQFIALGMFVLLLIFLIIFLAFWKDMTTPAIESQKQETQQLQLYKETAEILQSIKNDVQVLKEKNDIPEDTGPPN